MMLTTLVYVGKAQDVTLYNYNIKDIIALKAEVLLNRMT